LQDKKEEEKHWGLWALVLMATVIRLYAAIRHPPSGFKTADGDSSFPLQSGSPSSLK
jgi:hypothetical protein